MLVHHRACHGNVPQAWFWRTRRTYDRLLAGWRTTQIAEKTEIQPPPPQPPHEERGTKNEAAVVASAVIQDTVVTVSPKSKVLFVCKTVSKYRREMGVLRTG